MDMYAENILDHNKNPQNYGKIENPTISLEDYNPLCGDKIRLDLFIEKNTVTNIKFEAEGCAISRAAASMLTEHVKGKTLDEIKKISKDDIYSMLGIPLSPARVKCALLGYATLKKCFIHYNANGSKQI